MGIIVEFVADREQVSAWLWYSLLLQAICFAWICACKRHFSVQLVFLPMTLRWTSIMQPCTLRWQYTKGCGQSRLYKTARRLENESKLWWSGVGMHRDRWYTEVRLLIFWALLDQTQRNANPEMVVLFGTKIRRRERLYASNWNRLPLQNNFPEGGSKSFCD